MPSPRRSKTPSGTNLSKKSPPLGDDLIRRSIVVFYDAPPVVRFTEQFLDSWIRVHRDDEFGVDGAMAGSKDAHAHVVELASLDDLLDDLTTADGN